MGIQYGAPDPLQQIHVALDLETTGLDSNRDSIIEVGAVKFQGDQTIDTFQTFVNPSRPIPDFVQRLTGISPDQVSRAPLFSSVARDLEDFVGTSPVIGHNVSFDLRFLDSHDLALANTAYDTWDLASVLLPRTTQYSLGFLAAHFGVVHDRAHRALDDAKATQHVFLALLREAAALDPGLLAYLANLAQVPTPHPRCSVSPAWTWKVSAPGWAGWKNAAPNPPWPPWTRTRSAGYLAPMVPSPKPSKGSNTGRSRSRCWRR